MAQPEVAGDEGADGGVLQRRALFARQSQPHRVPSVLAVARQIQVLLDPELVEAVGVPGGGLVGVEGPAARVVAVGILHGGVCGGLQLHAGALRYGPRLLAGGGDEDAGDLVGGADAQAEGVPFAVDALPVLVGGNRNGGGQLGVIGKTWHAEGDEDGDEQKAQLDGHAAG